MYIIIIRLILGKEMCYGMFKWDRIALLFNHVVD